MAYVSRRWLQQGSSRKRLNCFDHALSKTVASHQDNTTQIHRSHHGSVVEPAQ